MASIRAAGLDYSNRVIVQRLCSGNEIALHVLKCSIIAILFHCVSGEILFEGVTSFSPGADESFPVYFGAIKSRDRREGEDGGEGGLIYAKIVNSGSFDSNAAQRGSNLLRRQSGIEGENSGKRHSL